MKAKGQVLSTTETRAQVRVFRESPCASCEGCSGEKSCHAEFIFSSVTPTADVCAENPVGAKTGDIVELYSENRLSLSLAFLIFVLPFLLAAVVYFTVGHAVQGYLPSVAAGAAFFVFFLVFAFLADRVGAKKAKVSVYKIIKESGR